MSDVAALEIVTSRVRMHTRSGRRYERATLAAARTFLRGSRNPRIHWIDFMVTFDPRSRSRSRSSQFGPGMDHRVEIIDDGTMVIFRVQSGDASAVDDIATAVEFYRHHRFEPDAIRRLRSMALGVPVDLEVREDAASATLWLIAT